MANTLIPEHESFSFMVKDLSEYNFAEGKPEDSFYISFEFLEHINKDLEIISRIPANSNFLFSVPSFDCEGHVRYFPDIMYIKDRYASHIEIKEIQIFRPHKPWFLCFGKIKEL